MNGGTLDKVTLLDGVESGRTDVKTPLIDTPLSTTSLDISVVLKNREREREREGERQEAGPRASATPLTPTSVAMSVVLKDRERERERERERAVAGSRESERGKERGSEV